MSKKIWVGSAAALGLLVLIFDSETAIIGASEGVDLSIRSVIPSLFPFLYLSGIITGTLSSEAVQNTNHISSSRRMLLLTGYLGGYPVGAQSTAQAYSAKLIAPQEVKRLLICSNNPGPAFLFGIVASVFTEKWITWALWGIHIVSSLIVYWLIPLEPYSSPAVCKRRNDVSNSKFYESIRNMAQICGWIVLFRVIIRILQHWALDLLPKTWKIVVCGLLEMTNGCNALDEITCLGLRFSMCALFISFGGCCTLIQTHSVTNGLYSKSYFLAKLLEGFCSFLLAYILQFVLLRGAQRFQAPFLLLFAAVVLIGIFVVIIRKSKNSSRILSEVGV